MQGFERLSKMVCVVLERRFNLASPPLDPYKNCSKQGSGVFTCCHARLCYAYHGRVLSGISSACPQAVDGIPLRLLEDNTYYVCPWC